MESRTSKGIVKSRLVDDMAKGGAKGRLGLLLVVGYVGINRLSDVGLKKRKGEKYESPCCKI